MNKLIEVIPNFSEGCNKKTLRLLARAIKKFKHVKLCYIDYDKNTNRSVFTYYGDLNEVLLASYECFKIATSHIDMRHQKGEHPRIGSVDVFPFVPLKNVSDLELIDIVDEFAKKVANDFSIPIYMYAKSAKRDECKLLPKIRAGEYENFAEKMQNGFYPDFGKNVFNEKTGATVVGVRDIMIAYNININIKNFNKEDAFKSLSTVAKKIRTSGGAIFDSLQAKVWDINLKNGLQITTNIHNYKTTPIHLVFETVKSEAEKLGFTVTGSELIGLIPKEALLMAGEYYSKEYKNKVLSSNKMIKIAASNLNFNDLYKIKLSKKILNF